MASDVQNRAPLPIPAPQTQTVAPRKDVPAPAPAAKPAGGGRSFADELKNEPADKKPAAAPDAKKPEAKQPADPAKAAARDDGAAQSDLADKNALRKTLQPLRKAAEANKTAVESAPVVAFLTGHLERLDPAAIPELVSDNEFLADALGESDVGAFLGKPMAIEDLVEALELPQSILEQARALGLDVTQAISPQEVLKALGLDPQRIAAELTQLKDNLRLEGVAPYMQRALAAGAAAGVGTSGELRERLLGDEAIEKPDWTKGAPVIPGAPGAPFAAQTTVAAPANPQTGGGQKSQGLSVSGAGVGAAGKGLQSAPAGLGGGLAAMTEVSPDALAAPVVPMHLFGNGGGSATATAAELSAAAESLGATAASGAQAPADMLAQLAAATATRPVEGLATARADAPQVGDAVPRARTAEADPFAAMDTKMRGVDVTRIAGESLAPTPVPAHAATAAPRGLLEESLLRANMLKTPVDAAAMARVTPTVVTEGEAPVESARRGGREPRGGDLLEALTGHHGLAPKTELATAAKPAAVSIDELRLAGPLGAWAGEGRGGAPTQDGERQERGHEERGGLEGLVRDVASQAPQLRGPDGGVSTFSLASAAPAGAATAASEAGMTTQERADMIQKIMDGASMMVKEGGGAMRLGLASAELGQLELAVNVQDDRVDLKIMTSSDRVRDAMAAELSRLRDALSVQNIQLGNVEVGVGQRQSGERFASFHQQQQSQQGQRELRELRQEINTAAARASVAGVQAMRQMAAGRGAAAAAYGGGSGRLEVRV